MKISKYLFQISLLWLIVFQAQADHLRVNISGISNSLEQAVRNGLSINRQKDNERLTDVSIRALYVRSNSEIQEILRANGFYKPEITQSLENIGEVWIANYTINPGAPVIIRNVNVQIIPGAVDDVEITKAVSIFSLKSGDQLKHNLYETGKVSIQDFALQKGYFEGKWEQSRLEIITEENIADIFLTYSAGVRYRFGNVKLPVTIIAPDLVEKLIQIQSGDYYEAGTLVDIQQRLQNTNYFDQVVVQTGEVNTSEKTVPVNVEITAKKKHAYRAGLGFGTDTGPRLAGAWDVRYLNSRGHRLENDLRLSLVRSSLSSAYLMPFFRSQDSELGVTATVSREDTDTAISNKFESSVQHLRPRWGWNETLSVTYQYENFKVGNIEDSSHLLIPGISYWKSSSDNPLFPRRGYRLSADLKGSVNNVISNVHFLQLLVRGKYIHPVGDNGRFISRAEVGGTLTSNFLKLPSSLRFFAGGDNSVRGFDLNNLGPLNTDGEVIGGSYLATGSIEYEHRLSGKWSAAVFSDFGNAFDKFTEPLEYSVGSGIHWQTPVAVLRFDVAVGISRKDNPIRLHIILGPEL